MKNRVGSIEESSFVPFETHRYAALYRNNATVEQVLAAAICRSYDGMTIAFTQEETQYLHEKHENPAALALRTLCQSNSVAA